MKTLLIFIIFSFSFVFGMDDLRNPFSFFKNKEIKSSTKTNININLVAISKIGDKYGALLKSKGNCKTVFVNDIFDGFLISKIFLNYVILSKDKKDLKLFIS